MMGTWANKHDGNLSFFKNFNYYKILLFEFLRIVLLVLQSFFVTKPLQALDDLYIRCPLGLRTLKVPESVHKAWAAGGADRTKLLKQFAEAGLDKETYQLLNC